MSCAEQVDYKEEFPSLWMGLAQMGKEGLERCIARMKSHPGDIICDGYMMNKQGRY